MMRCNWTASQHDKGRVRMNPQHSLFGRVLATAALWALLGGCSSLDVPRADNYPATDQKKARAVHHWDVLADDVAGRIAGKISAWPASEYPIYLAPSPGDTSFNNGFRKLLITRLLDRCPDLTAIFCMSDEMAIGAMRVLKERGLRVPEDISVVGFDDHEVSSYLGLTTVAQPMRLLGRTAISILLANLDGSDADRIPRQLPTSLVVRETTGPPRAG